MAVKRIKSEMDVVSAARVRIKNVFSNGVPVYLSFSGGKDSLVLADITLGLIRSGEADPKLLTVLFIDEEAIYTSVEEKVMEWRKKFILAGAKFDWWCIEVKHFSAYNTLTEEETFICWDRTKSDVWVRTPPPFARRTHPLLRPGLDNYQAFLPKITRDGIQIVGVRASESIQRLQYMAELNLGAGSSITGKNMIYPIYDWKENDVWLYLKNNRVDIPQIYLWMYQSGTSKGRMRISQYFSVDCVSSMIHMEEYEPGLWERILRREPNAYLAALYWDSELYRRSSKKRRQADSEEKKDYKTLVWKMLYQNPERYFTTSLTKSVASSYRKYFVRYDGMAKDADYKKMYDALIAGDPKKRTLRSIILSITKSHAEYAYTFRLSNGGEKHA
jgi:predicted phosphoadenosine phosphosulfate sulfurtransferase